MTEDFEASLQVLRGFDMDISLEVNEIKVMEWSWNALSKLKGAASFFLILFLLITILGHIFDDFIFNLAIL